MGIICLSTDWSTLYTNKSPSESPPGKIKTHTVTRLLDPSISEQNIASVSFPIRNSTHCTHVYCEGGGEDCVWHVVVAQVTKRSATDRHWWRRSDKNLLMWECEGEEISTRGSPSGGTRHLNCYCYSSLFTPTTAGWCSKLPVERQ